MMLLPQAEKTDKKSTAAARTTAVAAKPTAAAAKPTAVAAAKPRDQSPRVCYSLGSVIVISTNGLS